MNGCRRIGLLGWILVILLGCSKGLDIPDYDPSEAKPAGDASVSTKPFASFMLPAKNLSQDLKPNFYAGKALANQPWVKAPTITTARDGLGPIYNARTCLACHANGGRGKVPENDQVMLNHSFVRISVPGVDLVNGVVPEPVYGDQLQTQSIALFHQLRNVTSDVELKSNELPPEAYVFLNWKVKSFAYADGNEVELRYPVLDITELGYGPLDDSLLTSLRNAPPIHGVGLIELIPQDAIDEYADPYDSNSDGISGRVNQVWDTDIRQTVPGRFGLKANRPANLTTVTAAAFAGDIGISNPLFPNQPCTELQEKCLNTPNGNDKDGFELPMSLLELTTDFTRQLGVPRRLQSDNPVILEGRKLFYKTGCQNCHQPSFTTMENKRFPNLSSQKIWPYSDFLLHDMGDGLADDRPDFEASGSEWRTPPLWGVGLNKKVNGNNYLLHDGRARSVEEAILWHGGEAENVRNTFSGLDEKERLLIIKFVESL